VVFRCGRVIDIYVGLCWCPPATIDSQPTDLPYLNPNGNRHIHCRYINRNISRVPAWHINSRATYLTSDTKQIVSRRRNDWWSNTLLDFDQVDPDQCCTRHIIANVVSYLEYCYWLWAINNGQTSPHQHWRNNSELIQFYNRYHIVQQSASRRATYVQAWCDEWMYSLRSVPSLSFELPVMQLHLSLSLSNDNKQQATIHRQALIW